MHRIPLATLPWQKTQPKLELHLGTINLILPSRLGDLPWMLDRHDVAVVDTRDQVAEIGGGVCGSPADFRHLNVPYLVTSTSAAPATTGLLFVEPRYHPSLGLLDGFMVREENPGQFIDLAVALGMETATDLHWFADHRRIPPPGATAAHSTIRRVERAGVASAAAGGGLFFLAAGQSVHWRTGRMGLLMLLGGAVVAVVSDRIERHRHSHGPIDVPVGAGERVGSNGSKLGSQ
jgi:hypothetical protein